MLSKILRGNPKILLASVGSYSRNRTSPWFLATDLPRKLSLNKDQIIQGEDKKSSHNAIVSKKFRESYEPLLPNRLLSEDQLIPMKMFEEFTLCFRKFPKIKKFLRVSLDWFDNKTSKSYSENSDNRAKIRKLNWAFRSHISQQTGNIMATQTSEILSMLWIVS